MKWIWRINLLIWLIIYIIEVFHSKTGNLTSLMWMVGSAIGCTVEMAKEEIINKIKNKEK